MTPRGDGTEPIDDDEIIFRRVPVSRAWYSSETGCSPHAFEPRPDDETGICFVREKYCTAHEAAMQGPSKKGYRIIPLNAGKLRQRGITVVPRPVEGSPGHVELPELNFQALVTDSNRAEELMVQLATELSGDGIGPFVKQSSAN
jgi:hypothetical protein